MSSKRSKMIAGLTAIAALSPITFSYAAQLVTGAVSEINAVSVTGASALSLDTSGIDQTILTITVDSNLRNCFDVKFSFTNHGRLLNQQAITNGWAHSPIVLKDFSLVQTGGVLGSGSAPPANPYPFTTFIEGDSSHFIWNADYDVAAQQLRYADTATIGATYDLKASWTVGTGSQAPFAGTYNEFVTVTIMAGDQALTV